MPIFLNARRKQLPKGERKGIPVKPPMQVARDADKVLRDHYRAMEEEVQRTVELMLARGVYPAEILRELNALRKKWELDFDSVGGLISRHMVNLVANKTKKKLEISINKALGVDVSNIFDDTRVRAATDLAQVRAHDLIRIAPEEYFDRIGQAVEMEMQGIARPDGMSLTEYFRQIPKYNNYLANQLARGQVRKVATEVNKARQTEIGISKYEWETSKDSRVVGNPAGLYPKGNQAHNNHYVRQGAIFYWDAQTKNVMPGSYRPGGGPYNPPPDGPPGWAPNCRCFDVPIIDINELKVTTI